MKFQKKVLKNGLRIITVPMTGTQTALAMVLVEAGSDYENKEINGLSHFLEHMCFKGTTNRTGTELSHELDSLGAISNAFTGNEYTGYYAKSESGQLTKILDIISDMYLNPTFPENDIEIEKGVIIEEIRMYEDLPQRQVGKEFEKLCYGDEPAGRTILGPIENIKKFKQKDFLDYYKTHYVPAKTVVVVAGKINEKKVLEKIEKSFGSLKKTKAVKKDKVKISQKSPALKLFHKKTDQTHLVMGFHSIDMYDKRNPTLRVAATVLGSGFSSRLFKRMRDELGMCYYVRAGVDSSTDRGQIFVSSGVTNARFHEAVSVLIEEFKKLRDEKIDERELEKAKNYIVGKIATGLETSDSWGEYFGFQELLHEKILSTEELIKKIRAVKSSDIQKILKEIIKNSSLNLAVVGPHTDETVVKKILKV